MHSRVRGCALRCCGAVHGHARLWVSSARNAHNERRRARGVGRGSGDAFARCGSRGSIRNRRLLTCVHPRSSLRSPLLAHPRSNQNPRCSRFLAKHHGDVGQRQRVEPQSGESVESVEKTHAVEKTTRGFTRCSMRARWKHADTRAVPQPLSLLRISALQDKTPCAAVETTRRRERARSPTWGDGFFFFF